MSSRVRWLTWMCWAWAWASPAAAQDIRLEPSAALACLVPANEAARAPEYPFEDFKRGEPGRVKVLLTFTSADDRPAVKVLEHQGHDRFLDAVQDRVRQYRVPCLGGSRAPVQLVFDFVFTDDKRQVQWYPAQDLGDVERRAALSCLHHTSGRKAPDYPRAALAMGFQARVLARLRFHAPDQPPAVEVFSRRGLSEGVNKRRAARELHDEIEEWAAGYRLPCHPGQGILLTSIMTFVFVVEDGGHFGFRPGIDLAMLLPAIRGLRAQTLDFDFTRMACPFDVRMHYRQPALLNEVGELGPSHPARGPFLQWLRQLDLDLPSSTLDALFGDALTLTVPCLKLALQPEARP